MGSSRARIGRHAIRDMGAAKLNIHPTKQVMIHVETIGVGPSRFGSARAHHSRLGESKGSLWADRTVFQRFELRVALADLRISAVAGPPWPDASLQHVIL
jgi:hypothetical protein